MEKISRIIKAITFIAIGTITLLINSVIAKADNPSVLTYVITCEQCNKECTVKLNRSENGKSYSLVSIDGPSGHKCGSFSAPTCNAEHPGYMYLEHYNSRGRFVSDTYFQFPLLEHEFSDSVNLSYIEKQPTYKEEGNWHLTCARCNAVVNKPIPRLTCPGHEYDQGM